MIRHTSAAAPVAFTVAPGRRVLSISDRNAPPARTESVVSQEPAGVPLTSCDVPGFRLAERKYPAGLSVPPHCHTYAHLVFGIEGAYLESYGERTVTCAPRVLRYLPSGLSHSNIFENETRLLLISIRPETFDRVAGHSKGLDAPYEIRGVAGAWLAERLYAEFLRGDALSLVSLEGILLDILAVAARQSASPDGGSKAPRWLRLAHEYAETNFLRSVSLAEIATAAGVHRVHLAREFRRYYATTVGDFLRRRRVEHACHLLSSTEDPLADIAVSCGFSDQSHFGTTFRKHVGLTPSRFREMSQRPAE